MAVKKGPKKAPVVARKTGEKSDVNDIAETLRSIKTKFGDDRPFMLYPCG